MKRIATVLGTRHEIIKLSPVMRACERQGANWFMVHAGQEHSCDMDRVFFEQLGLPGVRYKSWCRVRGRKALELSNDSASGCYVDDVIGRFRTSCYIR